MSWPPRSPACWPSPRCAIATRSALILFSDQIELYVPPRKGRRHVLRLVREVLGFEPQRRGTNLVRALDFVNDVISRRAIVFLLVRLPDRPADPGVGS